MRAFVTNHEPVYLMQLFHSGVDTTCLESSPVQVALEEVLQEPIFRCDWRLILRRDTEAHAVKLARGITNHTFQKSEFRDVFDVAVM